MSRDRGETARPFDFLGFGALVVFIGAFQLMLDRGPTQDWFSSPRDLDRGDCWRWSASRSSWCRR